MAVGTVLIVTAAVRQPFSYDEITQIAPYGSDSVVEIVSATRQPPLDPLLGAMFQHLFGMGQLQQRLVPVLSGVGTLVLMSLLLRRLGLGHAGAFAVWVLATAPLMVRYSAYTRPYALPMFLMVLFAYAAQRWLHQRRLGWVGVAAVAAIALPLTRVPEPTVFLAAAGAVAAWSQRRGRLSWSQTWPLLAASWGVLVVVGLPMFGLLASKTGGFFDLSPAGFVDRFGDGVQEVVAHLIPLLASWFPWWPLTAMAVVAAVAFPASRGRLFGWLAWWPLLAAPVAFALAYHFLNPFPFESLPYRARAAFFFVPAYTLAIAALASVVADRWAASARLRIALFALLGGVLLGQLPATTDVVLNDAAPDFDRVADVLTEDLPDDAIVLYDRPAPAGQGRQPFLGTPRYMGETPYVETIANVAVDADEVPTQGPVYVLINGQCASTGRCIPSTSAWDEEIPGWRLAYRLERFTLYEPVGGQDGRAGVISALLALGETLGPELGYAETFAAAAVLQEEGRSAEGRRLIRRMYAQTNSDVAERIREMAERERLNPFES